MRKTISIFTRTALTLTLLLCVNALHAEEYELSEVQQQIDAFKQSKGSSYTPQTIQRADAYLGAARLAGEQSKIIEQQHAIAQAQKKLAEAKQTASTFMKQFASLIALHRDTAIVFDIVTASVQSFDNPSPRQGIKSAQDEFHQVISNYEQGKLDQSQTHALKAKQGFHKIMIESMPDLINLTVNAIGKAANTGAKKYAPKLYQAAKDKLLALHNFNEGLDHTPPPNPEQGLYLAREAKHMSEQVKMWRKKTASHEKIILKQRRINLQLANALNINTENNPMLTVVPDNDLLIAIQKNKQTLIDERQAHKQDIIRIKRQAKIELQRQLASHSDEMMQMQQNQMSTVKEAFRAKLEQSQAKLERETFDTKRQQKLHQLFKPNEVKILVNLDGSLLLRLSGLKFAPARSKIDAKYFDLLGRLNKAMSIYQDRSLRIEGHTDNRGDVKPNQVLSLKRAEAVRDFLIASGADGTRLKALGYGEVRPIASNEFPQGRTMNRRIDVVINAKK